MSEFDRRIRAVHPAFAQVDHRPWPLPSGRWTWRQRWIDLLFAHWPVSAGDLRALVPERLSIDEHSGSSWVGLVPFRMEGVMRRPFPDLPGISAFPEMNLRLYVSDGDRPGVWFVSLDAGNSLAVWAARRFFHLPYFRADMDLIRRDDWIDYRAVRRDSRVSFRGSYRPTSPVYVAEPGSLEHFLTERYCLYAQRPDGAVLRAEVQHPPWPLQRAEAELEEDTVAEAQGVRVTGEPAILHFSRSLDVVVWPTEVVA